MGRITHNDFTEEELLNPLKEFYNNHGRRPYQKDFKKKTPSTTMIVSRFGTWLNAIEKANISVGLLRQTDYTREYMLECLHKYYKENQKIPTTRGLMSQGYPNTHAYIKHFGSFKNALIESGLFDLREDKHQFCKEYTKEELLESLKEYMKDKTRIPTMDVLKSELSPSISTYDKRFNGAYNAFKIIGFDIDKQIEQDCKDKEQDMIDKYKKLEKMLGKTPSSRDIEYYSQKYSYGYAMKTYEAHFGSLYNLQMLCGFTPTVIGRNKSKEDLINDIHWLYKELGRVPSQNDLFYFDNVASTRKYIDVFGSWNNAIEKAGLTPNSKTYYSNGGIECLSYYEMIFTNMLEEYCFDFSKEDMYNEFMDTDRKFRFDFTINLSGEKYFIEIFGIEHRDEYHERTKTKIELCRKNNIPLIAIYPKEIRSCKTEDLYRLLINKLKQYKQNNT